MNIFENIENYGVLTNTYVALKLADAFEQRESYWDTLLENTETPASISAAGSVVVRVYISKVLKPLGPADAVTELSRTLLDAETNWDSLGVISVNTNLIGQDLTTQAKADLLALILYYSDYYLSTVADYLNVGYGYGYGYGDVQDYFALIN